MFGMLIDNIGVPVSDEKRSRKDREMRKKERSFMETGGNNGRTKIYGQYGGRTRGLGVSTFVISTTDNNEYQ